MFAKLKRASGPLPGRGEWQKVDLAFGRAVLFGCPSCSALGVIGPPPPVTADGMVISIVSCSAGRCELPFQVFLEGWPDVRRVSRPDLDVTGLPEPREGGGRVLFAVALAAILAVLWAWLWTQTGRL